MKAEENSARRRAVDVREIEEAARQIRAAISDRIQPAQVAATFATVCERWRDRSFTPRRQTIARVSERQRFSVALLEESLDALLRPFTRDALRDLASGTIVRPEMFGFVMAGNVLGGGLHEIALALIAGAGLIIKTASREPFFFREFIAELACEQPALGRRVSVFNWSRDQTDLTRALSREVDVVVGYGDDATIAALAGDAEVIGFGSKVSGALVTRNAMRPGVVHGIVHQLVRDVTLFEQLGCLSPHHIFVECDNPADAISFARDLAGALRALASRLPAPASLELEDAAALRSIRETARWRQIGGEDVLIAEGLDLSWAVIFDREASFTASPGLRCVYVSPVRDLADLKARLAPARGRIEAFAVAGSAADSSALRTVLSDAGVSYVAEPGAMQSPPLTWRHGGGVFLDRMMARL